MRLPVFTPLLRRWPLLGLAALLLILLLGADRVEAQTPGTLVSKLKQPTVGVNTLPNTLATDRAQPFTTGSSTWGYKLTRVDIPFTVVPTPTSYAVNIWSSDSDGEPDSLLDRFTYNGGLGKAASWAASSSGIDLEADTTYFVTFEPHRNVSGKIQLTESDHNDPGAAAGWNLPTSSLSKGTGVAAWNIGSTSWKIKIRGYAKLNPASFPTLTTGKVKADKLTLNFSANLNTFSKPKGSAFRVMATGGGTTRTIKGKGVSSIPTARQVTVTLAEAVRPNETLTVSYAKPASNPLIGAAPDYPFVARFSNRTLTNDTLPKFFRATVKTAEEATVTRTVTTVTVTVTGTGTETVTRLSIEFDGNLAEAANLVNSAFEVKVNGNSATLSGTPSIDTTYNQVTLKLASAVAADDTVTVSYIKPTSGTDNKLKFPTPEGLPEALVESFTDQPVTNNTRSPAPGPVSSSVQCSSNGYWVLLSGSLVGNPGAQSSIPCDMAKPAWTFANDKGDIRFIYDQGNPAPPVNQPRADGTNFSPFTYTADANNRAVRGADGHYYREQRVNGRWQRSNSYGRYYTDVSARRASWNAHYRSRNLPLVNPDGGTFPSSRAPGPPLFQSAGVQETALTMTFDVALDMDSVPSPGAFRVTVNNARRNVASGGVAVSGKIVTLTLASAVGPYDTVKIRYTKQSANPLQDASGSAVATFADLVVTNNTQVTIWSATLTAKASGGATGCDDAVSSSDRKCQNSSTLTDNSFTLGGTDYQVKTVLVLTSANRFEFLLDRAIPRGWTLYVDGRQFAVSMATLTGGEKYAVWSNPGFAWTDDQQVSLRLTVPPVVPVFESAAVDRKALTVNFNADLDGSSVPAPGAFRVTVNNARRNVASSGVAVSGKIVTLTLATAVGPFDTVKVRYTKPSTNPLESAASGSAVNTFADQEVTNNTEVTVWTATLTAKREALISGCSGTTSDAGCASRLIPNSFTLGGTAYQVKKVLTSAGDLELELDKAIPSGWTLHVDEHQFSVSMARSTQSGKGAIWSRDDPVWTDNQEVSLSLSVPPVVPVFQRAAVDGATLTVTFDADLDMSSVPAPGAFRVTVNNARRNVASGGVAVSGKIVTLTLASAVTPGDTVKVRYTKPSASPLQSAASGSAVATFADQVLNNNTTLEVTGVSVVSNAGADRTYGLHDTIEVRVTFNGQVVVTGTPRLKIKMAPTFGEKWATYASGSGTSSLTFDYTVVSPNQSPVGIAVLANSLELNGGTINSGNVGANLAHTGLAHDPNHKVSDTVVSDSAVASDPIVVPDGPEPTSVESVTVTSGSGADKTYGLGDTIHVQVTFVGPVEVDTTGGTPRLKIDMDPADWGEKWAAYASGSGTNSLTFAHTVVEPNYSTQGIAVLENSLELNGGTISFSSGHAAFLGHTGLAHDANHKVDWQTEPEPGGGPSGTSDPGGASGESGGEQEQSAPASVSGVNASSSPQANATYGLGETIQVTLTFSEAVDVTGSPRLKIDLDSADGGEQWAAYQGGSGTATLTFTYTVAEPNISTQGIAVLADTLELNGGTVQADGVDANLAHTGLAHNASHKVDWRLPAASVTGVEITSDPGDDDTYASDDVISITLTFNKSVDVTGIPRLKIDMDPAEWGEKWAAYQGGSGTTTLTFTHTVVEPNISTQGIAVLENSLELNGGTMQSDSLAAQLAHTGLAHDAEHKVDWQLSEESDTSSEEGGASGQGGDQSQEQSAPASVSGAAVASSPASGNTYALGETISITLTFSEAVDVTGTPRLKIDMDPAEWGEKWVAYASGSGSGSLTFAHTVVEPNISTQGIAVLANTLELNGGTIQASGVDADLAHTGLAHDASHKVDWRLPKASVTGVEITSDPGSDDTYATDDVITITLTFSKAVDVTGTPRLKIDMDPADWGEKWAAYQGGSGTTTLTFTHTVVEPNISTQGIAVLENSLELNGGTMQSDGLAALLAHTGLAHDAEHKVDWQG